MFFTISKVITFLIDPIFLLLLFCLFCLVKKRKGFRLYLVLFSLFLCFYAVSTDVVSNAAQNWLEGLKPSSRQKKHYDAVIVLGGMTRLSNSTLDRIEFKEGVDRVLAGIELLKRGKAEYLILSGMNGDLVPRKKSEALILREFAIRWGVDPGKILVESTSRNTYENARESAAVIEGRGFEELLLITSAFHMYRAYACFVKAGIAVDTLSVDYRGKWEPSEDFRRYLPSSEAFARFKNIVHELVGIFVYGVSGKARFF